MLTWKGEDFSSKGIIVEFTPKISKPQKRITTFTIPGRSGFLSVDEETYDPFLLSVECHAKENADFESICNWLDGYGTLSFGNERLYTAIINNAISFEQVAHFKKFIVQFLVNPIAESTSYSTNTINSSPQTVYVTTSVPIEPKILITASGNISLTINNKSLYLDNANGDYIIDCEKKIITKNGVNASNIMRGEFLSLKNSSNTVSYTGNITSLKFEYKRKFFWGDN